PVDLHPHRPPQPPRPPQPSSASPCRLIPPQYVIVIVKMEYLGLGVVVLKDGEIVGGDEQYLYDGTYDLREDGTFNARVAVTHAGGEATTVFGGFGQLELRDFSLRLEGKLNGPMVDLMGFIQGHDDLKIGITLKRWRTPI
ncbi:MAG: hypothetical protein ACLQU2_22480, partial [Candidatus Binataceae bacterium]